MRRIKAVSESVTLELCKADYSWGFELIKWVCWFILKDHTSSFIGTVHYHGSCTFVFFLILNGCVLTNSGNNRANQMLIGCKQTGKQKKTTKWTRYHGEYMWKTKWQVSLTIRWVVFYTFSTQKNLKFWKSFFQVSFPCLSDSLWAPSIQLEKNQLPLQQSVIDSMWPSCPFYQSCSTIVWYFSCKQGPFSKLSDIWGLTVGCWKAQHWQAAPS